MYRKSRGHYLDFFKLNFAWPLMQHNTTQHNSTQRNATQRNATQRNTTQQRSPQVWTVALMNIDLIRMHNDWWRHPRPPASYANSICYSDFWNCLNFARPLMQNNTAKVRFSYCVYYISCFVPHRCAPSPRCISIWLGWRMIDGDIPGPQPVTPTPHCLLTLLRPFVHRESAEILSQTRFDFWRLNSRIRHEGIRTKTI